MKELDAKTYTKSVPGYISNGEPYGVKYGTVELKCTCDYLGERISVSDGKMTFLVKARDVEKLIEEMRNETN